MRRRHHAELKRARKRAKAKSERVRRLKKEQRLRASAMTDSDSMKMCGRKFRYVSKADAMAAASEALRRKAVALRAYKCPICHGWHLTKLRAMQ